MAHTPSDATVLLRALGSGEEPPPGAPPGQDGGAKGRVFEGLYGQLRRLAEQQLSSERPGHTLQPTALVHEAWLRLADEQGPQWERPAYFFSAAAEAMRRVLIEHARRRGRPKHGGGLARLPLESFEPAAPVAADWVAFDDGLAALAREDARAAEVVRLRVYAGLGVERVAETLDVSTATVKREWAYGRAWMRERLGEG